LVPAPGGKSRIFIFQRPVNYFRGRRVSYASRLCFVVHWLTKQNSGAKKPLSAFGEDILKRALGINKPTKRRAETA
jgi:hypothetical protein